MNAERDKLEEVLDAIAKGSRRSKIARLREIFDKVEAAKANGAGNKEIVAGLAEHGLIFDVNNFKNARSRILKERAIEALTNCRQKIIRSEPTPPSTKNVANSAELIAPNNTEKLKHAEKYVETKQVEAERPPGITDAGWSEMKAKARAAKRKQKLNSGE